MKSGIIVLYELRRGGPLSSEAAMQELRDLAKDNWNKLWHDEIA